MKELMTVMIFDDMKRTDTSEIGDKESTFTFLNRYADPKAASARALMEECFQEYPSGEKERLRTELRSGYDNQYYSALFELYCHRLFSQHGYTHISHPNIPGETKHPDFLVQKDDVSLFYLECTVSFESKEEQAKQAILDQIYSNLDPQDFPDFHVGVIMRKRALTTPSSGAIRRFLLNKMKELNADELIPNVRDHRFEALPRHHFIQKGWEIDFMFIPKPSEKRGMGGVRPVGLTMSEFQYIDSKKQLLNRLKDKVSRYGELQLPYVIAVNSMDIHLNHEDILETLFGTQALTINQRTGETSTNREKDGLWRGPAGQQNTKVSAILVAHMVSAINARTNNPVLWHNPWAQRPLPTNGWEGHCMMLNARTDKVELIKGKQISDIL